MKAITLRNLPPDLTKAVRREAERKRTSINKAVISLLESKGIFRRKTKVENRITKSWTLWPGHGVKKRRRSSTRRWRRLVDNAPRAASELTLSVKAIYL